MIPGFEHETAPLSDYEKSLVNPIVLGLETKIGEENAITSTDMIKAMQSLDYTINAARLRKIINHIRREGFVRRLVGTKKGYYIEYNDTKYKTYLQGLKSRIDAQTAVLNAMKNQ